VEIRRIRGVLDDGSCVGPTVPHNTATTVVIPHRSQVRLLMEVTYPSGVPLVSSTLTTVLTIQRSPDPCIEVPTIRLNGSVYAGSDGKPNVWSFTLPLSETRKLTPGRYFFDVWGQESTDSWNLVRMSALVVVASLSPPLS